MTTKKVYAAIADVTRALAKEGISKDRKNEAQGYKFRGIDDVYNALAPFLADAKLCILPSVQERECVERRSVKERNGQKVETALFYVTVKVDFAFVSAEDGSEHHVVTFGEAMDSGDKATNKAMSAAYKYAAMQAFCIPTEGDNDADATTHTVAPRDSTTSIKKGAMYDVKPGRRQVIADTATQIKDALAEDRDWDAYSISESVTDHDERVYMWSFLDSGERARLKAQNEANKERKAA